MHRIPQIVILNRYWRDRENLREMLENAVQKIFQELKVLQIRMRARPTRRGERKR
jgi:hypothetical protein